MTTDDTNGAVAERPMYSQKKPASHNHMSKASNRIDGTAIESLVSRQENAASLLNTNKAPKSKNEARIELPVSHQENATSHNHMSKASNRIDGTAIESPVNRQENAVSLLYTNKAAKPKNVARTELPVSHQENAASHTRMSKASSGTSNAGVESMVYHQENNISRIHVRKTSGDINATATDTMMNQPEQSCQSRNTLLALEREIKARERKVGAREKLVDQWEKDLALKHTQYETARTCIIGYEARIKELENSNKVLQQLLDATRGHSPQQTPVHDNTSRMAPCQETTSTPYHGANSSNIQMQRDLSITALKGTITNQLHAMEQRITNNHHQSALLQQQIQSSMFSQQLMSMIQTLHLKPAQYAPTLSTCPNHTATQASAAPAAPAKQGPTQNRKEPYRGLTEHKQGQRTYNGKRRWNFRRGGFNHRDTNAPWRTMETARQPIRGNPGPRTSVMPNQTTGTPPDMPINLSVRQTDMGINSPDTPTATGTSPDMPVNLTMRPTTIPAQRHAASGTRAEALHSLTKPGRALFGRSNQKAATLYDPRTLSANSQPADTRGKQPSCPVPQAAKETEGYTQISRSPPNPALVPSARPLSDEFMKELPNLMCYPSVMDRQPQEDPQILATQIPVNRPEDDWQLTASRGNE